MQQSFDAQQATTKGIETRWISIEIGSKLMEAYIAKPAGEGAWPAVIVLMEIFGINSHIRDVTERLAQQGYVAIAPNYYHRTTRNIELRYTEQDVALGRQHKEQTTREGILVDMRAVIDYMKNQKEVFPHDKMACVGFCFGGHVAFIAAGMKEIAATVAFYPGGVATSSPGDGAPSITHSREIQGEILCLFGEQDPLISHEETVIIENALRKATVRHEIVRYAHTGHGFFCNQRADYDASAAEDAWSRLNAFFTRNLK